MQRTAEITGPMRTAAFAAFVALMACSERAVPEAVEEVQGMSFGRQVAATEALRGACVGDSIFVASISRLQAIYREVVPEKNRLPDSVVFRSMASSAGTTIILATDAALAAKLDLEAAVSLQAAEDLGGVMQPRMSARDLAITKLELTRFRGHFTLWGRRSPDAETAVVSERV